MKLYEINQAILNCIDGETGEILDFEQLQELQLAKDEKLEGVALYIKDLAGDVSKIKAEEAALAERRKAMEAKADRLKEFLKEALGGEKFETARVRLSFRKSTKLEITDSEALIHWLEYNNKENCIRYKAPEIAASEVTTLIKAGEAVPGATLAERLNLQIK